MTDLDTLALIASCALSVIAIVVSTNTSARLLESHRQVSAMLAQLSSLVDQAIQWDGRQQ